MASGIMDLGKEEREKSEPRRRNYVNGITENSKGAQLCVCVCMCVLDQGFGGRWPESSQATGRKEERRGSLGQ